MKRVFWSGVGYAAGLGSSIYVQRRVRHTVERYAPEQVRTDVADRSRRAAEKAKDAVIDLRTAAAEGVETMRQREQELRDEFVLDEPHPPRHRPARLHRR